MGISRSILAACCLGAVSAAMGAALEEDGVHPGFDLTVIRPKGFEPAVTGMQFLPGGRMAISTWRPNEVYILDGYDGPRSAMKAHKVAAGFKELMGLYAAGDTLYASDQDGIYALTDGNKDGFLESRSRVGGLPFSGVFHEWSFGLVRKGGKFFTALSVGATATGKTLVPQRDSLRGTLVSMAGDGKVEVVAAGLRAPDGLCLGPDSGLFATDNQGSWLPASKFIHVVPGRSYGHHVKPPGRFDEGYPAPPAVWLPYGTVSKSPTQPAYAAAGPYAGQFFVGDIAFGVVRRLFIEKVDGEWQGCALRFSGGFEAGIHRMLAGSDGSLYLGGLGNGDLQNWGWREKRFGLQRLKPNGKNVFEILSVRARKGGFELAFSSPPGPEALEPARYRGRQWWYEPTDAYGGPEMDVSPVPIKAVRASGDGSRVFLEMGGLRPQQVVHVHLEGVKSKACEALWTPDFWYTLNAFSGQEFAQ